SFKFVRSSSLAGPNIYVRSLKIMFSPAYLLFVFISFAHAANDWSTPCTSGVCSYDLPASAGPSSGTVKIWGSTNAISDITPAAGWQIISCSPDAVNQDIRLVCM
ncbi:hypothetical protein BD779DRAFT_1557589, partial [Infundibulicybe gibba]